MIRSSLVRLDDAIWYMPAEGKVEDPTRCVQKIKHSAVTTLAATRNQREICVIFILVLVIVA